MAITADVQFIKGRAWVVDVDYPFVDDVSSEWIPETGLVLPRSKGFPHKYDPPRMSFKVARMMCDSGLENVLKRVLATKRRSTITPNFIWSGLEKFSHRTPSRPAEFRPAYEYALEKLRKQLDLDTKFTPLTIEEASVRIPQNTSPGLPYIRDSPGFKKGDVLSEYLTDITQMWSDISADSTRLLPDSAAFARSHISDVGVNKVRPVWALPLSVIVQEARFAVPLIDASSEQNILRNTAFGCEMMKGGMMWINSQASISAARYGSNKYFMTDYSAFDSSVPAWLIRDVFSIVMEKFEMSEADVVNFKRCVNYFINTPVQVSDGRRYKKSHGIPSGSMFTNLIGSMVNMVVSWTACQLVFGSEPLFDVFFGDDALIALHDTVVLDIDQYALCVKEVFGMNINVRKSYWTSRLSNIHFLGYYNFFGTPYKDSVDLFAAMLYPQHLDDTWEYAISRSLGCLLASAGTSTELFHVCRKIYLTASAAGADIDEGLRKIRENPRTWRHMMTMGVRDLRITEAFFTNINLSIPIANCNKFIKGVNLVR